MLACPAPRRTARRATSRASTWCCTPTRSTRQSIRTLELIQTWLREELPQHPGARARCRRSVYGVTVNARDLASVTESDRLRINTLVLAGIFLILLVLVRRPWLAAYLLVTVLFSYYATLGATTLLAHWWTAGRWARSIGACRSSCSRSWWRSARTTTSC